ncbi:protein kinase [Rhodomicrobium sp. Az07]|uniref:serine/threonine protein kinase n=1 Tax=Rhodomicrobium sp. Az07 TaxID=2839034 RepID=UPI001BE69C60|nr:bifunctional serine/threonine-protein kinase/universal stress protein [Rhodomicrobium sp. Az07]MBT3070209.1 protein kinase [Rhodomicrobium sp. Az07]
MAKPTLQRGDVLDGFVLEDLIHKGGMARLWSVTKPGIDVPMLMKVPVLGEGQDPAAIVSFEMEQMIMPRLSGPHVPRFIAAGDFALHPFIVMERLPGRSLLPRLSDLPMPYEEVADIGWKIATALDDLHRQHVIHLDIKPSNILFRESGEAVLLDFGLSHHQQLPDLMQEEFRLPYGTAPYMAPEQLLGVRTDPRSDQFALGVLLYFFSTGERPFGESERLNTMKKRLWQDPKPPRSLRKDYPLWLQEIVLRCLEVEPAWRYPTAAQLAFDLSNYDQIRLTARSERTSTDSFWTRVKRRFNPPERKAAAPQSVYRRLAAAPIVAVAVDLSEASKETNDSLREAAGRALAQLPSARLACLNVLKMSYIATRDTTLDDEGHNKHVNRLVQLQDWAQPLKLKEGQITFHVLEATDPASAILDYAEQNKVDQILLGARANSLRRSLLGSVSAKVAGEAGCTVTVVRVRREDAPAKPEHTASGGEVGESVAAP